MSARALRAASATALALAAAGCGAKTGLLVPPPPVEIALGGSHSCARMPDRTVRCWGNDGWRAHAVPDGDGGATFTRDDNDVCLVLPLRPDAGPTGFSCRLSPRLVRGLDDATDVALGGEEACALRRGGTVRCWGTIDRGPAIASMELAAVPLAGLHDIVQIALSETSGCALDRRGVVRCWGNLGGGAAGPDGPTPFALSPLDDAVAIALGADYVCALRRDGAVRCLNPFTLLLGAELDVPSLRGARSVASGFAHVCATFGGDTVRCLGSNPFGQLGTGTVEDSVASAVDVRW